MKKIFSLLIVVIMCLSIFTGCKDVINDALSNTPDPTATIRNQVEEVLELVKRTGLNESTIKQYSDETIELDKSLIDCEQDSIYIKNRIEVGNQLDTFIKSTELTVYILEESVDAAILYTYFVAVDNSRDFYEPERLVTLEQYENIVVTGSKQYVDLFCGKV